jgi:hypothetical protein
MSRHPSLPPQCLHLALLRLQPQLPLLLQLFLLLLLLLLPPLPLPALELAAVLRRSPLLSTPFLLQVQQLELLEAQQQLALLL